MVKAIGTSRVTLATSVLTCLALGAMASGPATMAAQSDRTGAVPRRDRRKGAGRDDRSPFRGTPSKPPRWTGVPTDSLS